jgi:hypothetical protein
MTFWKLIWLEIAALLIFSLILFTGDYGLFGFMAWVIICSWAVPLVFVVSTVISIIIVEKYRGDNFRKLFSVVSITTVFILLFSLSTINSEHSVLDQLIKIIVSSLTYVLVSSLILPANEYLFGVAFLPPVARHFTPMRGPSDGSRIKVYKGREILKSESGTSVAGEQFSNVIEAEKWIDELPGK